MIYGKDKPRLRGDMQEAGLQQVRFRFDFAGIEVITTS
jgi:hypothetical protein